jgi:peptidoglycan/xylan/chitin deacetylase (PgdA/CDA1 family)
MVLAYHDVVSTSRRRLEPWNVTRRGFADHLSEIAKQCEVVPLSAVAELVGTRGRYVALTFDDGHLAHYVDVVPQLLDSGVSATFFLPTGVIDGTEVMLWSQLLWLCGGLSRCTEPEAEALRMLRRAWCLNDAGVAALLDDLVVRSDRPPLAPGEDCAHWLTWGMARDMSAAGMDIGAHTVTHRRLGGLDEQSQRTEIAGSVARVRLEIKSDTNLLAYPFGAQWSFDSHTTEIVRELELLGFSGYGEAINNTAWDPSDVRRLPIGARTDVATLQALLADPLLATRRAGARLAS